MSGFARFILVNYKQDLLGKNTGDNTVDPKNRIAVLCNADFTPCHRESWGIIWDHLCEPQIVLKVKNRVQGL